MCLFGCKNTEAICLHSSKRLLSQEAHLIQQTSSRVLVELLFTDALKHGMRVQPITLRVQISDERFVFTITKKSRS